MLESLFNKVACQKACNFIKKRLQHRCFPVNIAKFLRTPLKKIFEEHLNLRAGLALTATSFPVLAEDLTQKVVVKMAETYIL